LKKKEVNQGGAWVEWHNSAPDPSFLTKKKKQKRQGRGGEKRANGGLGATEWE